MKSYYNNVIAKGQEDKVSGLMAMVGLLSCVVNKVIYLILVYYDYSLLNVHLNFIIIC